jgi:asparagine N-glycosylation enzyme membrane subunit Stt3
MLGAAMTPTPDAPRPWPARPWVFWTLAVLIALVGCGYRLSEARAVARADGMHITDNDTVRRLCRLHAIDAAEHYPIVEPRDGAPDGTQIHWTLPMDWVIRAIDPFAHRFFPRAARYEAGACLAGPVLAAAAILLLAILVRALLGPGTALLCALFYAFAYSTLNVSWFGNGDHQNLQHLALVGALLCFLLALAGSLALGAAAGALLGFAEWVSTESQLFFFLLVLPTGALLLARTGAARRAVWRAAAGCTAGMLALLALGFLLENDDPLAFHWDQVSWFQIAPVLVFGLFLVLLAALPARGRGTAVAAALIALAAGGLVCFGLPGPRAAFAEQRALFARANVWLAAQVSEYRSALVGPNGFSLAALPQRFTWLIPLLPVLLLAVPRARALGGARTFVLLCTAAGTFACALWEVKLAHLFAMVWPLVLVLGARGLWNLRARDRAVPPGIALAFAAVLLVAALIAVPPPRSAQSQLSAADQGLREACELLQPRVAQHEGSVLAMWDQGAHLMYYAGAPVVASGYHRNLDGIHDSLRLYTSTPAEEHEMRALLQRRQVRWVVVWFDRLWLTQAPQILGTATELARVTPSGVVYTPAAHQTLFWRLRYGGGAPGFREIARSRFQIGLSGEVLPMFQIYEVAPAGG